MGTAFCRTLPPIAPAAADSAAIVFGLHGASDPCHIAYFVRTNSKGERLQQSEIIESTYAVDERIYWLNAKPGTYALVACTIIRTSSNNQYTHTVVGFLFFDEKVSRSNLFQVDSGKLTVVGAARVRLAEVKR